MPDTIRVEYERLALDLQRQNAAVGFWEALRAECQEAVDEWQEMVGLPKRRPDPDPTIH